MEAVYSASLKQAIRDHKLISLQSLGSNFPADTSLAALSYAESASVVQFIVDHYGPDKMASLLAVFREGSTYDDATKQALGVSINGLDAAWRKSLGIEETPTPAPTPTVVAGATGVAAAPVAATPAAATPASSSSPIPPAEVWVPVLIILGGAVVLVRLRSGRR